MASRSASEVIDLAIRENRRSEWLLYFFAILFATVGLSVLVCGVVRGEPVSTVAGVVASTLFWPAMTSARRTRKENIAIRLLEAPLSRADTAKDAAEMLRDLVNGILSDNKKDGWMGLFHCKHTLLSVACQLEAGIKEGAITLEERNRDDRLMMAAPSVQKSVAVPDARPDFLFVAPNSTIDQFSDEDASIVSQLLNELSVSTVPRIDTNAGRRSSRYVFFSDSETWRAHFPQVHAVWDDHNRIVVFYGWGIAESFYQWAVVFHPEIAEKLQNAFNKIIVIVVSIVRMSATLLHALEEERNRVWSSTAQERAELDETPSSELREICRMVVTRTG
jgi:hypothetical protein